MGTKIESSYGAWAGPGPSYFRTVAEIWFHRDTGSGYDLSLIRWVQVNDGGSFGGTNLTTSWNGNVSISGPGPYYAHKETGTYHVRYGETLSFGVGDTKAHYTGGRYYESSTAISYTVPKPKYTVSYNANGGTGAPGAQTKTWGTDLTLSKTIPTRTGYKFLGWGTSPSDITPDYQPGDIYKSNAGITLYAVWKRNGQLHLNQNGAYKTGRVHIKDGGVWKTGVPWKKENGTWKRGGL